MRGYFGIGVEGLSKPMNGGNLLRSANAFGASFVFTIGGKYHADVRKSDTSAMDREVPFYEFESFESVRLPCKCQLVGVEICEEATVLPSFRHPRRAAYVLGMERGGLTTKMIECCDHLVKIPTKFSLNLATAGAILMYDRIITMKRFGARPIIPGGPIEALPEHIFGQPLRRRRDKTGEN